MKVLKFVAFLFYRYYSTGPTKDIPYFSTLCALVMLLVLHIFQILVLFNIFGFYPIGIGHKRWVNFLIIAACLTPVFLVMSVLIPKSYLETTHYEESIIRRGNIALVCYIICSMALVILLAVLKNRADFFQMNKIVSEFA
jgi:hypothetical protein